MTVTRPALLPALAAFLAACGGPARVDVEPASVRLAARGQSAKVHATPRDRNGRAMPGSICRWASSDEKVATVKGHNDAEIHAVGPGDAAVRCEVGGATGEVAVQVRVIGKVTVSPTALELRMLDEPRPTPLAVEAFDDRGEPVIGRRARTACADENVCRGDDRAQLWAVGEGSTTAWVEVEGSRSATVAVKVVDARSAEARPRRVTGDPMEAYEKEYERRQREAAAEKR